MVHPVRPPAKLPLALRPFIALSERLAGVTLMPSRLLAWQPSLALAAALLELASERAARRLGTRMARLVRLRCSFAAGCPFCIDLNAWQRERDQVGPGEMAALRGECEPSEVASFSPAERLALTHAAAVSASPVAVTGELLAALVDAFGHRDTVVLAALAAKVNYFARLAQGLGVAAPGRHGADDPDLVPWVPPARH